MADSFATGAGAVPSLAFDGLAFASAAASGAGGGAPPLPPAPSAPAASAALTAIESQVDELLDSINNIWIAAGDGELARVQAYIAGGISVNAQDEYGYTPLFVYLRRRARVRRCAAAAPRGQPAHFPLLPSAPTLLFPQSPSIIAPPRPQPRGVQLQLRGRGAVAAVAGRRRGHQRRRRRHGAALLRGHAVRGPARDCGRGRHRGQCRGALRVLFCRLGGQGADGGVVQARLCVPPFSCPPACTPRLLFTQPFFPFFRADEARGLPLPVVPPNPDEEEGDQESMMEFDDETSSGRGGSPQLAAQGGGGAAGCGGTGSAMEQ